MPWTPPFSPWGLIGRLPRAGRWQIVEGSKVWVAPEAMTGKTGPLERLFSQELGELQEKIPPQRSLWTEVLDCEVGVR